MNPAPRADRTGRRKGPRVTLLGLLILVLGCAVVFAALRDGSELGASGLFTFTIGMLLASILGAIKGRDRTFWLGFALFGWGYAVLAFGPWFREEVGPYLLSSILLARGIERLNPEALIIRVGGNLSQVVNGPEWLDSVSYSHLARLAHCLSTIPFAFTGGLVARLFADGARSAERRRPEILHNSDEIPL